MTFEEFKLKLLLMGFAPMPQHLSDAIPYYYTDGTFRIYGYGVSPFVYLKLKDSYTNLIDDRASYKDAIDFLSRHNET